MGAQSIPGNLTDWWCIFNKHGDHAVFMSLSFIVLWRGSVHGSWALTIFTTGFVPCKTPWIPSKLACLPAAFPGPSEVASSRGGDQKEVGESWLGQKWLLGLAWLLITPKTQKKGLFFINYGIIYCTRIFSKPMKLKDDEHFLIPSLTKSISGV